MISFLQRIPIRLILGILILLSLAMAAPVHAGRQITDALGRTHDIPEKIKHMICSGSGCLRLVTYLEAQNRVTGVDDMETRKTRFDARPYSIANPGFRNLPVFGGFRGQDNPEKIIGLKPVPQVIFKTYPGSGYDPVKLEKKTGIPVITLEFGDLARKREDFYRSLTILGQALDREKRAQHVIEFFEDQIQDLENRTQDLPENQQQTCFVGGIAFKGPHGFASTEPGYPPFHFIHAKNVASPGPGGPYLRHTLFSKEKLLTLDPNVLFLDLSTLQMGKGQGGLHELKTDPVFRELTAVKTGQIFGVLPYNGYTQNPGSILADAWFIGKTLFPDRFRDIDPTQKADEIYTFLVSEPLFDKMNATFGHMVFNPVDLK